VATKKDFTQVAHSVFNQAIGEESKPTPFSGRKANSSKGGKIGGTKRAANMTKEGLSEQAKKAAHARWSPTFFEKNQAKKSKP
jgi:hypothetical protein